MAILPWRARRQLLYFGIFSVVVLALVAGLVWHFWPKPTCFDAKQNQGEEDIDCGEPCAPCVGEVRDLSVLWVRPFKSKEGFYDAAALIKNPNSFAGLSDIKYQFKLYDANNILIAIREGSTFINPNEEYIIFESNINAGPRVAQRAIIEFEETKNWKRIEKEEPIFSVAKKDFTNLPFPRLQADIKNQTLVDLRDVSATAVLFDEQGNTGGASYTKIDSIPAESVQTAYFTWPAPFDKEPASIKIFLRIDLTKND